MMRFVLPVLLLVPAAAAAQVTPGQWETTTSVASAEMPGVPAAVLSMMKKPRTTRYCLSAEDAARGPQEMMKRDKSCKFTRYSMTGGRFDSVMVCSQGGGTMTATSHGSYSPTVYTAHSDLVMTGASSMKMSVDVSGKLVGTCKK